MLLPQNGGVATSEPLVLPSLRQSNNHFASIPGQVLKLNTWTGKGSGSLQDKKASSSVSRPTSITPSFEICNQKERTSNRDNRSLVLLLCLTNDFCDRLMSEKEFDPAPRTISYTGSCLLSLLDGATKICASLGAKTEK